MLRSLSVLLCCQLVGEVLTHWLALPVPGPVLGMILLFLLLVYRGGADEPLQTTSQGLLQHLSLLFVPAGTGILVHLHRIGDEWLPLLVALVLSTVATLAVTAWAMKVCMPPKPAAPKHPEAA